MIPLFLYKIHIHRSNIVSKPFQFLAKMVMLASSLLPAIVVTAQDSSSRSLTFSGYAEIYYQYDLHKPPGGNRPGFVYSHNRHNEINLNLGFVKVGYTAEGARANLAFAAGTYVNANYAAEPGALKNVLEANAGVKLSKKDNLWLDAGIFPSHIGFESAVSKDCWTVTRSMLADNSPYFEAGAKITYTAADGKWLLSAMALNGWQRIKRLNGNSMLSWGTQFQYKPSEKILLNYSTFLGTDKPDSARQLRFFHNFYGILTLNKRLGIIAGFDLGSEERIPSGSNTWFTPAVIIKYSLTDNWSLAGRIEYYHDKYGVMIPSGTANGFQTAGYSLNIDLIPAKNILVRLEGKTLRSKDAVFIKGGNAVRNNSSVIASLAASF